MVARLSRAGATYRKVGRPYETVKRGYYRWIEAGVFDRLFEAITGDPNLEWLIINATLVHAQAPERGTKGERKRRLSADRAAAQHQAPMPSQRLSACRSMLPSNPASRRTWRLPAALLTAYWRNLPRPRRRPPLRRDPRSGRRAVSPLRHPHNKDGIAYKNRSGTEASFARFKQWRASQPATTSSRQLARLAKIASIVLWLE